LQTHAVSAVLLIGLGLLTLVAGVRNRHQDEKLARSATTWRGLAVLAFGLSLDNVVVGFSLGLGGSNPLAVATTIAWFSVLFTWIGMSLGRTSRRHWERVAKIGAGLLLVGFGAANGTGWL
ncbi:MAG: manganese efflux pump, partial [Synechococcaceae cyanobacterium]